MARAPAMRVQARLVVLDQRGQPAQTLEEFSLDYQSIEFGTLAYQWIRRYFRRQKVEGRNVAPAKIYENRLDDPVPKLKPGQHKPRCTQIVKATNTICDWELPCPRHRA